MLTFQFKLEFVPLEEDLLSLELDDVARDLYLVSPRLGWKSLDYVLIDSMAMTHRFTTLLWLS
jgi:hypothetical protein